MKHGAHKQLKGRSSPGSHPIAPHKQHRSDKTVAAKAKASQLRDKGKPKMKERRRGDVEG